MPTSPYGAQVRLLLRAALLLFTFTVVVGILNGTDLVEFGRKVLLTHVHAGTLGWITMSVIAGTFWLFALGDREPDGRSFVSVLAVVTVLGVVAFALAFLTTSGVLRPAAGTVVLATLVLVFGWAVRQALSRELSVPHLGMLAALAMSVAGGIVGVLLAIRLATGAAVVPDSAAGAHPAAMVVGFLVPVGMALIEWALDRSSITRRATIAGWLQIALPFVGGVFALVGVLFNIPPLLMLGLPLEVIGLVILVVRLRAPLMQAFNVMRPGPERFGALALAFLVVNIALLVYLVVNYFSQQIEPPAPLLLALDHSIFIGVMTNAIFALVMLFRGPVNSAVDDITFYGLNLGHVGFLAGLLMESPLLKEVSTPVLGTALLVAIVANIIALGRPAALVEPSTGALRADAR